MKESVLNSVVVAGRAFNTDMFIHVYIFSDKKSLTNGKSDGFLTSEELAYWSQHYKVEDNSIPGLPDIPSPFLSLKKSKVTSTLIVMVEITGPVEHRVNAPCLGMLLVIVPLGLLKVSRIRAAFLLPSILHLLAVGIFYTKIFPDYISTKCIFLTF